MTRIAGIWPTTCRYCDGPIHSRNMCDAHYQYWQRHGHGPDYNGHIRGWFQVRMRVGDDRVGLACWRNNISDAAHAAANLAETIRRYVDGEAHFCVLDHEGGTVVTEERIDEMPSTLWDAA